MTQEMNRLMKNYTAVLNRHRDCWIGWIEEIPGVNCQESTREELLASLRVTLQEALEFNRKETREAIGQWYFEAAITI